MNKKTLTALKGSISHWERMRDDPNCEDRPGINYCDLCEIFFIKRCVGCPVSKRVGMPQCRGTPYTKATIAFSYWKGDPSTITRRTFHKEANKEIKFLKSLLPD